MNRGPKRHKGDRARRRLEIAERFAILHATGIGREKALEAVAAEFLVSYKTAELRERQCRPALVALARARGSAMAAMAPWVAFAIRMERISTAVASHRAHAN